MNKDFFSKKKMFIIDLLVFAVLLIVDQFTKYLSIINLKGKEPYVIIDGVLEFDYLENRGSAFGLFQNQKIFILLIGFVFLAAIFFFMLKIPQRKKFCILHLLISMIIAGGIGNITDRIRFDYVVDFISFVLIDYPIFNAADCYIVVATIGLFVLLIFVYKDEDLDFINLRK